MAWSNSTKKAISVVGSGLGAGAVGVGAVYFTDQLLPSQMEKATHFVADHIVYPHMHTFSKLAKGLRTAHENYDKRKREALVASGQVVPEEVNVPTTPREQAHDIAGVLVKSAVGLTGDFAATYAILKGINRFAHIHGGSPMLTTLGDAAVTLGVMVAMPLAVPVLSENIHNNLRKKIRDIMGISNEKADDLALPITYVSIPNLIGMGAALGVSHLAGRVK